MVINIPVIAVTIMKQDINDDIRKDYKQEKLHCETLVE